MNYYLYGKFKNLYSKNTELFSYNNDISDKQKELLLDKFHLYLSLSDYNRILKNILFLKAELNFEKILSLFEMSIVPIKDTKQIIFIDEEDFVQFQELATSLFEDKLIITLSTYMVRLLRIKNYQIAREKIIKLHKPENCNLSLLHFAVQNTNLIHTAQTVVRKILKIFDFQDNVLSNLKGQEISEKTLLSVMNYFKEIRSFAFRK